MPGGFPLGLELCNGQSIAATSGSKGTAVTTSSTDNTKGSYTQITASTLYDACWALITFETASADVAALGGYNWFTDIAVGSAGNETIILPNLTSVIGRGDSYSIPISIPAGTRIAARTQSDDSNSSGVASTIHVSVDLLDGAFTHIEGIAGYDAIGALTATTTGTAITPGASANAKGSYVQLIASTARDYLGLIVVFDPNVGSFWANAGANALVDVAIGAAGSEVIIIPNLTVSVGGYNGTGAAAKALGSPTAFIPIPIPSGTRLSAAAASSKGSTNVPGLTLYGAYQ